MPTMLVCEWETPASKLEEKCIGDYCIRKKEVEPGTIWSMREYNERPVFGYDDVVFACKTQVVGLEEKGKVWMTNSPREYYSMHELAARSKGDVLVGGLGLGELANILANRRDIKSVEVVEKSKEVIDLVGKNVDKRVKITHGDIFHRIKELSKINACPSTIILDIYRGDEDIEDVKIDYEYIKEMCPNSNVLVWNFGAEIETEKAFDYLGIKHLFKY